MSNEKIIEEILMEAHQLGIENEVFALIGKLKHDKLVDRYQEALIQIKSQKHLN